MLLPDEDAAECEALEGRWSRSWRAARIDLGRGCASSQALSRRGAGRGLARSAWAPSAPGSVLKAQPVPTRGPAAVMPHQVIAMRRAPSEPGRCTEQPVRSTLPNSPRPAGACMNLEQPGNRTNPSRRPRSCSNRCRGRRTDANEPVSRDRGRGCGQPAQAHGRSRPWRSHRFRARLNRARAPAQVARSTP